MEAYLVAIAVFAGFYAMLALGLNMIWGIGGIINLGLAGFFGTGAYATALLTTRAGWPIWAGIVAAGIVSAAAGAALSLIVARLKGDYLAIVTLGFAEVIRLIASNEIWLTNGTDGISNIPGPWRGQVAPWGFNLIMLGIVWTVVIATTLLLGRLSHAPFGRVLRAIRDDEMVAAVAGKRVLAFKTIAFAISSAVLGVGGALYAHYNAYIAPDALVPLLTIYAVLALVAGGTGRMRGAVLGALVLVGLMEGMRFLAAGIPGLRPVQVAAVREMSVGLMLILVLRFRPEGLLPERPPRLAEGLTQGAMR